MGQKTSQQPCFWGRRRLVMKDHTATETVLILAKTRPANLLRSSCSTVSTVGKLKNLLASATPDSFWVRYSKTLTIALLRAAPLPSPKIGKAIINHKVDTETCIALDNCFSRCAIVNSVLAPIELIETLRASNRSDLFIGGVIDHITFTITFWRGDLTPLTVPFSAFEHSGDGTRPDFNAFSVTDYGQTVCFGSYEASTESILYEFDREYRRCMKAQELATDLSFGAALRRLRKQKKLTRSDFKPISAKTIARIERNEVKHLHDRTIRTISRRLNVAPEEIATY